MTTQAERVVLQEQAGGKIVEVHITGTLTRDDYQTFTPRLEELIGQHGRLRLLVWLHDFTGWTSGALWEDIKFDARHFSHFERLAIVGESRWQAAMAVFCKPFTAAKVSYFDEGRIEEARHWVAEGA